MNNCYMHATGTEICPDCKKNYLLNSESVLVQTYETTKVNLAGTFNEAMRIAFKQFVDAEALTKTPNFSEITNVVLPKAADIKLYGIDPPGIDQPTKAYVDRMSELGLELRKRAENMSLVYTLGIRREVKEEMTPNKVSRDPLIYVSVPAGDLQFTIKPSMVDSRISYKIKEKTAQCLGRQAILDCLVLLAYKKKITSIDMFKFESCSELSQNIVEKVVNLWESIK